MRYDAGSAAVCLMGISAYRNIMDEPLMEEVSDLLDAVSGGRGGEALERYAAVFYRLRRRGTRHWAAGSGISSAMRTDHIPAWWSGTGGG